MNVKIELNGCSIAPENFRNNVVSIHIENVSLEALRNMGDPRELVVKMLFELSAADKTIPEEYRHRCLAWIRGEESK